MGWNPETFPPLRKECLYGDRVVDCFADRPHNLHMLLVGAALAAPTREALVGAGRRLTWHEVLAEVDRVGGALLAAGVRAGDRVAMVMGNTPDFVIAMFGIFRIGAVAVPISVRCSPREVAYAISNCSARMVLHDAERLAIIPDLTDRPDCIAQDFAALTGQDPLPDPGDLPGEQEVALILHTSGTTGRPKGAMLTHIGVIHAAIYYESAMGITANDRVLSAVPLNHVTGIAALIAVSIRAGATLILMDAFKAKPFLDLAEAERMTYTLMVPAMYNLCLLQPDFAERDLKSWRLAAYGGAPMPEPAIRRLSEAIPGLGFANCYGATETIVAQLITPPAYALEKREFVGAPLPGTEAVVMDEQGCELPPGSEGEIWLRGPTVVRGYWNDPEATGAGFVDGYWRSGDLGSKSADGFLQVLDRAKDMINRGGLKIYSAEVESVLIDHPAVTEAAAISRPCEVLGERVHVVVVVKAEVSPEELKTWCKARLSDYKVPETYDIRSDVLPRNANGKIDKAVLRQEIAATA